MSALPFKVSDGHMVLISVELVLDAADIISFGVFPTVKTELRVSLNIAVVVLLRFMKVVAIFVEVVVLVVALGLSVEVVAALLVFDAVITIGTTMAVAITRLATAAAASNINLLIGLAVRVKNRIFVFPWQI